jgi:hypothetical protein
VKEIKNKQSNGDFASLPKESNGILSNQSRPAKKVFVEPTITRPVDVLETTTAFLQGNSGEFPGSTPTPST